jgi:hypothetical protein
MNILKGWDCPKDQPYVPHGVPENVLPVLEGVKREIEHTQEMQPDTKLFIQKIRRTNNPMFAGAEPERTL